MKAAAESGVQITRSGEHCEVVVAVVRRAFVRPPRMHIAPEGYVILGLISFLMITLLVFESAGIAADRLETGVTPPPLAVHAVYPKHRQVSLAAKASTRSNKFSGERRWPTTAMPHSVTASSALKTT